MNRTIAAILLVAVLAIGGGLIAVTAYQAGLGTAVTTAVAEGGNVVTTVPAWGYGYGYGASGGSASGSSDSLARCSSSSCSLACSARCSSVVDPAWLGTKRRTLRMGSRRGWWETAVARL